MRACSYDPNFIGHEPENTLFYFGNEPYVTKDCSALYYTADCALYKQSADGTTPPQKIASNAIVKKIYDSGEMYYTTLKGDMHTLHYYDGKKDTVVKENLKDGHSLWYPFENTPAIAMEIFDVNDSTSAKIMIAVGASLSKPYEGQNVLISLDESNLCYTQSGKNKVDTLYEIEIAQGKVGAPRKINSGSFYEGNPWTPDGRLVYLKESEKAGAADLYINNDKKIAHDAHTPNVLDAFPIYYQTNWNTDADTHSINLFQDGKVIKVTDNVYDFDIIDAQEILYLQDYNFETRTGALYQYKNGQT